ncbi:hypothetical protein SUGI_0116630, partial [Cryptomeria japonica]
VLNSSSPQFHIVDGYKNITLRRDCEQEKLPKNASKFQNSDDWYCTPTSNLSLTPRYCKSEVQLPVLIDPKVPRSPTLNEILLHGFEVKWNLSKGCESCVSRNDTCHYNTTTMRPFCQTEAITNQDNSGSKFKSMSFIFVIGILGSALLVLVLLQVIAYRKKISGFSLQVHRRRDNPQFISQVETFLHNFVDQMPTRYSYSDIKEITNNFTHKLGEGGFGEVL